MTIEAHTLKGNPYDANADATRIAVRQRLYGYLARRLNVHGFGDLLVITYSLRFNDSEQQFIHLQVEDFTVLHCR